MKYYSKARDIMLNPLFSVIFRDGVVVKGDYGVVED